MKNHINLPKQNFIYSLSLFVLILFSSAMAIGQETAIQESITIKGAIFSDFDNEALPGASIVIKNTIKGFESDNDGNFEIKNLKEGDVLSFYYTGFKTQEIRIKNDMTFLKVFMKDDATVIDPVVLVGDADVDATYKTKRSFWKRVASVF